MEIVLQNIGKQFKTGTRALDHVTFTIPQGEFVSVIGPSGAGKTTLFRILNGVETPGDGAVLFDGSDISSMSGTARKNVKRSIGTIYQDFALVENATCRQNVLNASLPDMAFLPAVCGFFGKERVAEADALLERVGLADKVHEPVKNLSGGQKQRVAIARMLMQRAPIMIFDDSLSAVDAETDAKIRDALDQNLGGSTVILISHRITTLMKADCILVLSNGQIAQMGTHQELISQPGIYRDIYNIQTAQEDQALLAQEV